MKKTDMMIEFEIKIDSVLNWDAIPIGYTKYLESELIKARGKAEAYDRLMSGGKKTLKEWANIFGMVVAVDMDGEAWAFAGVPVIDREIWRNNEAHYGQGAFEIPKSMVAFDGDWQSSLTLPDGWEE